jgi:hypothetical protein
MRKKSGPKRKILEDLETRLGMSNAVARGFWTFTTRLIIIFLIARVEELLHEKINPHMLPTASSHSPKDQPNMPVSEHFSIPSSKQHGLIIPF